MLHPPSVYKKWWFFSTFSKICLFISASLFLYLKRNYIRYGYVIITVNTSLEGFIGFRPYVHAYTRKKTYFGVNLDQLMPWTPFISTHRFKLKCPLKPIFIHIAHYWPLGQVILNYPGFCQPWHACPKLNFVLISRMIASSRPTFRPHPGRVIRDLFRLFNAVYGIVRKQ